MGRLINVKCYYCRRMTIVAVGKSFGVCSRKDCIKRRSRK